MEEQQIIVWCENEDGTIKEAKIFKEISEEVAMLRYHRDLITANERIFMFPINEVVARINAPF